MNLWRHELKTALRHKILYPGTCKENVLTNVWLKNDTPVNSNNDNDNNNNNLFLDNFLPISNSIKMTPEHNPNNQGYSALYRACFYAVEITTSITITSHQLGTYSGHFKILMGTTTLRRAPKFP